MNTKHCKKCNKILNVESFNKNSKKKDGLQTQCRDCQNSNNRNHYARNKEVYKSNSRKWKFERKKVFYTWLKTKQCVDCGISDIRVLEFDHVRGKKSFDISRKISGLLFEELKKEISKCDIVCSNCHKIRTAERENWYKFLD